MQTHWFHTSWVTRHGYQRQQTHQHHSAWSCYRAAQLSINLTSVVQYLIDCLLYKLQSWIQQLLLLANDGETIPNIDHFLQRQYQYTIIVRLEWVHVHFPLHTRQCFNNCTWNTNLVRTHIGRECNSLALFKVPLCFLHSKLLNWDGLACYSLLQGWHFTVGKNAMQSAVKLHTANRPNVSTVKQVFTKIQRKKCQRWPVGPLTHRGTQCVFVSLQSDHHTAARMRLWGTCTLLDSICSPCTASRHTSWLKANLPGNWIICTGHKMDSVHGATVKSVGQAVMTRWPAMQGFTHEQLHLHLQMVLLILTNLWHHMSSQKQRWWNCLHSSCESMDSSNLTIACNI